MAELFTLSAPDLAALLCSRVCHDIISPVGAINNGLELLDEGGADEDAMKPDPPERPQRFGPPAIRPHRLRRRGLGRHADRHRRCRSVATAFLRTRSRN